MALETFAPSIAPSPGGSSAPEVSLNKAEFGDGYSQPSPSGLNHIRDKVELRWNGITLEQKYELDLFFRTQGGYKTFLYKPHGFQAEQKWTCEKWDSSTKSPLTFAASLVQSFSLAI